MSNHLAIAAVTATFADLVNAAVSEAVDGAQAVTVSPGDRSETLPQARANVFLYHVAPNDSLRNADLPNRRSEGTVVRRPVEALNLDYLISFFGTENVVLEPQRMLGSVVATLNARPVLSPDTIRRVTSTATADGEFLLGSDLAEQVERVRLTLLDLGTEELSKIWSVFYQIPYVLSVAYRASVVLIEGRETPRRALPVRHRGVGVVGLRRPVVDRVQAIEGRDAPIVPGTTIVLAGSQLAAPGAVVRLGPIELEPDEIGNREVHARVPDEGSVGFDALRAGVFAVQVVHRETFVESNARPLVVRPVVLEVTRSDPTADEQADHVVTVRVRPRVAQGQRVHLWLNEYHGGDSPPPESSRAYGFEAQAREDRSPDEEAVDTVTFFVRDVEPGSYLVRVQVDGAESPLAAETSPQTDEPVEYGGPLVEFPS